MERRPFLQIAGLSALGLVGVRHASATGHATVVDSSFEPAWSFVLLPDTQCYSESYPEVFLAQTRWIANARTDRAIRFVLHLGDITNHNIHPQWQNARRAMDVLVQAGVPFLMVPGNHDLGPWGSGGSRASFFNEYFIQPNPWRPGDGTNAWRVVTVGEARFLLLALEFGPRDAVVAWANEVLDRHPDHHAILITHAYLYDDSTRYDWGSRGRDQSWNPNAYGIGTTAEARAAGVHDGEALWQRLVSRHRQFAFTFNGHVLHDGIGHLASTSPIGTTVHQMLVNYQCGVVPDRGEGGGGFLRLVEVGTDGRTVRCRDYSPHRDQWLDDADRNFTITLDRDLRVPLPPAAGG